MTMGGKRKRLVKPTASRARTPPTLSSSNQITPSLSILPAGELVQSMLLISSKDRSQLHNTSPSPTTIAQQRHLALGSVVEGEKLEEQFMEAIKEQMKLEKEDDNEKTDGYDASAFGDSASYPKSPLSPEKEWHPREKCINSNHSFALF